MTVSTRTSAAVGIQPGRPVASGCVAGAGGTELATGALPGSTAVRRCASASEEATPAPSGSENIAIHLDRLGRHPAPGEGLSASQAGLRKRLVLSGVFEDLT